MGTGDTANPLHGRTVLQVIPELAAGGAERTTVDIARALVAVGATALVASAGGRLEGELAEIGGRLIKLPLKSKSPLELAANRGRLIRLIRAHGVDLVHARSRAPAWSALWAARATGIPFVTTYHGTYSGPSGPKRFYNSVMARGDRVIANSAFIARHVEDRYPEAASRLVAIPRGTDLAQFDPEAVSTARIDAAREALGVAAKGPPLLFLPGRLTRWKGQMVFVAALAQVAEAGKKFRAVMAGDVQGRDTYAQLLQATIDTFGLSDRVRIAPHIEDMPAALLASDVVVSASTDPEAFGRVAVEAQAMGKPIIATNHGGSVETIRIGPEATGWRVPPANPDALAAAILKALGMAGKETAAMGARGRAFVADRFSLHRMTDATLKVYTELLAP
ncbi:MAG: glycosyltransferase family 4 protein [Pseudomonadota bacterium]